MDWYPLYNSVRIAAVSTVIVYFLGIFLANVVARAPRVVKGVLDVVLTLPLVLPPTVVGYLLLRVFGPRRTVGAWLLGTFGIKLTMVWYAAILATVVVSFPLMYRTARGAFESFDENLADAARTLGRSERWIFWRVKMPYCQQGIVAGAVLAFAMICGYTPGSTATVSTTVYQLWRTNDDAGAFAWVMVNLGISAVVLLAMNWFEQKGKSDARAGARSGSKAAAKPGRVRLGGAR